MKSKKPGLGAIIARLRARNNWTLKELSQRTHIPLSTLSKVEHGKLTLTYDKLQLLSERLGMRMSELFAEDDGEADVPVTARRSIGGQENALRVNTPNYDYYYLCTELKRKRMVPVITRLLARSAEKFGEPIRHHGEEFIYVLRGKVVVITEFYDPVTLNTGQCIYLDSTMAHAYLIGEGCDEAEILGVVSSDDEDIVHTIINAASE